MLNNKGFGALKGFIALVAFIFLLLFAWRIYPMLTNLLTISSNSTINIYITIGIILMLLFDIIFVPFNILFLDGRFNLMGGIAVQLMFVVCAVLVAGSFPVFELIINMMTASTDSMLLTLFIHIVCLFVMYGVPIITFFYYEEKLKLM